MGARVGAAGDPGLVGDLAEVAAGGEGEEGLDEGAREGERVGTGAAFLCGLGEAGAEEVGERFEVGLGEGEGPGFLVVEDVLAKFGVEGGEAFGGFDHSGFLSGGEGGAAADEAEMDAIEEAGLVYGEGEGVALPVELGDAVEDVRIQGDLHAVLGAEGGQGAVDGFEGGSALA